MVGFRWENLGAALELLEPVMMYLYTPRWTKRILSPLCQLNGFETSVFFLCFEAYVTYVLPTA